MSITATLVNKITIGEEYFVLVEWDKDIVNVTKDFLEASSWMDYYNLKSCWNMCGNMEANSKFSDNKLIVSAKFNSRKESNFSISIIIGGPCSKDSKQVESWIKEGYSIIASNSGVGECISSCMPKRFSQQFFLSKNSTKYINHTSICQGLEGRYLIFLEANCEYKENNITFSGHYHESLYANK
jgi:hypothetical protein